LGGSGGVRPVGRFSKRKKREKSPNRDAFRKRKKTKRIRARRATDAATFGKRCGVFKNNRENVAKMRDEGERR